MEDFRSKSCGDGRTQIESSYNGEDKPHNPSNLHDFRCFSASYANTASSYGQSQKNQMEIVKNNEVKFKKGKSSSTSSAKNWSFNDPELQRKKRVASYQVYSVEGKVKGSFRKSFRWLKDRYSQMVYGWR